MANIRSVWCIMSDMRGSDISLRTVGASCVGNTAVGLGKLVCGLLSLSPFLCAGALYTFCMTAARGTALAGLSGNRTPAAQRRYCRAAARILMAASALYALYSARFFVRPETVRCHPYVAIGIAAFTFAELGLNIAGLVRARKGSSPLVRAVRTVNLAASLLCLVLTQTVLLSFASEQTAVHPAANGLFGMLMGTVAALLGLFLLRTVNRENRTEESS